MIPKLGQAQTTSFRDDFDRFDLGFWYVSDGWNNGAWQNCTWSRQQIGLQDGNVTLTFSKKPYGQRDYSCGAIQTRKRFGYGTYEARFKTDVGSGINAAFFTYIGPAHGAPHDEIDFEVLTKDTSKVSLNTYVSGKAKNGSVAPVPMATTEYNTYAFVWLEDSIRWYVNGNLVHTAQGDIPRPINPQKIYFSHWGSDTFVDWMGPFSDPGRPLTMSLDWVAYTAPGEPCQFPTSVACKF
ncbi:MAG: family 16 glycosylhydrolase [Hyphomicrobiales bacterium]